MDNTTSTEEIALSPYFENEKKRKLNKRRRKERKSRTRRRYEAIIWTVILALFVVTLVRILPNIIKGHSPAPPIKTRKM